MDPGTKIVGRYTLEQPLGRGGMGTVFVARDARFGGRVAVKLAALNDDDGGAVLRERFEREAWVGNRLGKIEGFVRALDWGEVGDGKHLYLVMDLVPNARPLDLRTGSRRERLDRLRKVAGLVALAHEQGVVHRDLKPANVLQAEDGALWLADFGLAKVALADGIGFGKTGGITGTGAALGTPLFMSPEQFEDVKRADARADVYALGVMLYFLLTEKYPFGGSLSAILKKQRRVAQGLEPVPRPSAVEKDVPPELDALCADALVPDRRRRLARAADFMACLDAHLAAASLSVTVREPAPLAVTVRELPPDEAREPAAPPAPTVLEAPPAALLATTLVEAPREPIPPAPAPAPGLRWRAVEGPLAGKVGEVAGHDLLVVGRVPRGSGLKIAGDAAISRNHCVLEFTGAACHLSDLGSRNGTFVNGERVTEASVGPGDRVRIGRTVLAIEALGPAGSPPLAPPPAPAPARAEVARFEPEGYEVVTKLCERRLGTVYLARDKRTGRRVSIQTHRPTLALSPDAVARFLREALPGARLEHPHATRLLGSGFAGGTFHFVSELVEGPDLETHLRERGSPLEIPVALEIADQVLDALGAAHARGLVHGDVTPANVLLAELPPEPRVKLAELGLARHFESSGLARLTGSGGRQALSRFLSPEQVEDPRRVGPRADLYSLAATLFFALTLETPLLFSTSEVPILTILEGKPRPLRSLRPDAGRSLEATIARCLAKSPDERLASARELREALGGARRGRSRSARP